ncbi:MAG: hypothetical protein J4F28_02060 [Nitrosopumilaceae archaeon]|nr:hypothetical protein [Nitrosopumilaceae archaeon]
MALDKSKCDRPGCTCTGVDEDGNHIGPDPPQATAEELDRMADEYRGT